MSASNTPNTVALASPIYNPDIDPTTMQIYGIMKNDYPDELVAQYRQIITAMPTVSPFNGAISNPRSCDISQVQTGLGDIKSQLANVYNNTIAAGTPIPANLPRLGITIINGNTSNGITTGGTATLSDGRILTGSTTIGGTTVNGIHTGGTTTGGTTATILPGDPGYTPSIDQSADAAAMQAILPGINSNIDLAAATMNDFQDHTDRAVSNLPNILGMVQTALGVATAVGGLLDPCLGLNDFLGSLLGSGSGIMNKINAAINQVKAFVSNIVGQVQAVLAQIQAAIAKVMALVQSLIAMIEAEIMKLIKSLIDSARLGLAQLLGSLPKDPCFKSLVGALGSGPVIGAIAKAI